MLHFTGGSRDCLGGVPNPHRDRTIASFSSVAPSIGTGSSNSPNKTRWKRRRRSADRARLQAPHSARTKGFVRAGARAHRRTGRANARSGKMQNFRPVSAPEICGAGETSRVTGSYLRASEQCCPSANNAPHPERERLPAHRVFFFRRGGKRTTHLDVLCSFR